MMHKLLYDDGLNALRKDRARRAPPSDISIAELEKRGLAAAIRHDGARGVGDPTPVRRIEFGEVETGGTEIDAGRVNVAHDIESDGIVIHGVAASLHEIAPELRTAFVSASAAFADAVTVAEQTTAREAVGRVVAAVLARHKFLSAEVKRRKIRQRYD
jgi:hypothetical protein